MKKAFRELDSSIGEAVAKRTILRGSEDEGWEHWLNVADRVANGNTSLDPDCEDEDLLKNHIARGINLMSGRHLQHGDPLQLSRNQEVFTNCATASFCASSFYLLLNGSGVGRSYDDALLAVDWRHAPEVICLLSEDHPDYDPKDLGSIYLRKESCAVHLGEDEYFVVPDSREGWGKALEKWENMAYERSSNRLFLDFSNVREKGSPINGMQKRPSSGPVPTMRAFMQAYRHAIEPANLENWERTMIIDHMFAECVVVGGARRSARMAIKYWKDPGIFKFIDIKRGEVSKARGFEMWSSNNSVALDQEFWDKVKVGDAHATRVFHRITENSYFDGTGEPGCINVDKLDQNPEGIEKLSKIGSKKMQFTETTQRIHREVLKSAKKHPYSHAVNPCSEITLAIWGGFCVIADLALGFCDSKEECEHAVRAAVRALIRVNLMDSIYNEEVKRTNRIGVGLTGVQEFAWKFFGYGFRDLVNEELSKDFWSFVENLSNIAKEEAASYAESVGLPTPHTVTTCKPSGTVSKLFSVTEGWHLPSMAYYLRWVMFRTDDPKIEDYRKRNYPIKKLKTYNDTVIVGFPTTLEVAKMGLGDKLVTAGEATPEEQYKWLMLGEKYWIGEKQGNQISYTLKYDPKKVDYASFCDMFLKYQSKIRCCSVMPQVDMTAYEYQPEEPIAKKAYDELVAKISHTNEDVSREHLECEGGSCPIDFRG